MTDDNWPFDRPLWRQRVETWGIAFALSSVLVGAGFLFAVLLNVDQFKPPVPEICHSGPPAFCIRAQAEAEQDQ